MDHSSRHELYATLKWVVLSFLRVWGGGGGKGGFRTNNLTTKTLTYEMLSLHVNARSPNSLLQMLFHFGDALVSFVSQLNHTRAKCSRDYKAITL